MPLKLRVISDQYKQLGKASSQVFEADGGRIGRAPDNDWILPDPDRYVSSHHAKVTCQAGTWLLEDISTNGVFVNDSDIPLSVSGPRKLKDGDRLRLGDYDIVVSIAGQSEPAANVAPSTDRSKPARSAEDQADYLRHGTFRNHSRSRTREHMGDDLGEELDITGLLVSKRREEQEADDAVAAFDRAAKEAAQPKPSKTVAASQPANSGTAAKSLLDDLLEEDSIIEMPSGESWHMSTRRLQARKPSDAPAPPVLKVVQPAPQKTPDAPPARESAKRDTLPATSIAATTARAIPQQNPEPKNFESSRTPQRSAPAALNARSDGDRARRLTEGYEGLQAGVEALCRGAGIEPNAIPAESQGTLLTLAGQMLREVVLDLMEALRSRNEQKSQMSIENTALQPGLNNPLKFAPSVEDALRRLLDGPSMRYMGAVDALREVFGDLKNHQVAMESAMSAAVNDLLSRVDPAHLQERFDQGLKRNPASATKGKYWELYGDFFPLLNQRDQRGWPAVFTQEFTRAYSEQVAELDRRRK